MNRKDARKIAETITNEQIKQMFDVAKEKITDWTKVSSVNKGISKGIGWNILARYFDVNKTYSILSKINMVREFGEFLPNELKPPKKTIRESGPPIHQDPIFD